MKLFNCLATFLKWDFIGPNKGCPVWFTETIWYQTIEACLFFLRLAIWKNSSKPPAQLQLQIDLCFAPFDWPVLLYSAQWVCKHRCKSLSKSAFKVSTCSSFSRILRKSSEIRCKIHFMRPHLHSFPLSVTKDANLWKKWRRMHFCFDRSTLHDHHCWIFHSVVRCRVTTTIEDHFYIIRNWHNALKSGKSPQLIQLNPNQKTLSSTKKFAQLHRNYTHLVEASPH